jgi:hypothetical protein
MFRIVTHDHYAVLVRDIQGARCVHLLRASGPLETAYLHIITTILRKMVPQISPCVVGVVRKVPTGYAFDCTGVWDNRQEAERHYEVMPIPPDAHGKMMVCFDGSTRIAGAGPSPDKHYQEQA